MYDDYILIVSYFHKYNASTKLLIAENSSTTTRISIVIAYGRIFAIMVPKKLPISTRGNMTEIIL
jgi:hypothetical protein